MKLANKSSLQNKLIDFVSPSSQFEKFILLAIVLNSITIAFVDYGSIDNNYQPSTELSVRNNLIEKAEYVFTIIFTLECLLKCAAYGLWRGKQAYIKNGWNILDGLIVILSILGLLPNAPNFTMLRSFRVLRPLRSISKLPQLRKIVSGFIASLSELANVMVLLLFILVCFALFGVTFWRGLFHARCRLTPYPVRMPIECRSTTDPCWKEFILETIANPSDQRCLPLSNDDPLWVSTEQQDCIWPLDEHDTRICSISGEGDHSCSKSTEYMGVIVPNTTCGSNYDVSGNPRFINSNEPYGFQRMADDVFYSDLNWGFTNFDDFGSAFLTSFQILTMEGWSDIMYRTIDASYHFPAIIAFVALILVGSQLSLNIVLAVISNSLDSIESDSDADIDKEEQSFGAKLSKSRHKNQTQSALVSHIQWLVDSKAYEKFILFVIIINTIVLGLDHYGISDDFLKILEAANVIMTVVFCIDMVLCITAIGMAAYWSTLSTFFDGIIAVASGIELIVTLSAGNGNSGKSVMSVFRSLRLVRLFKMLKSWKSLHSLLNTVYSAAAIVRSFGILLSLFVFIYALVGMQLFANRLHFDSMTGVHIGVDDPRYYTSDIPRHNFDTLSTAVTTVFQVLSGENWNEVMYDCSKATSRSISSLYFISLVVLGIFIVLNLFLAILLKQFERQDEEEEMLPETQAAALSDKSFLFRLIDRTRECSERIISVASSITEKCHLYRRLCRKCKILVRDRRFEIAVTFAILLSSITLALDNPLSDPSTCFAASLGILNYVFTVIFTCEFLIKVFAHSPIGYFSDSWNILDFSALGASLFEISNVGRGKSLRALRTLRVLRPLKMINRFPEVKLVVDALLSSLPSVVNVGAICCVLFLTFAIFGVTFLKGTFYQCNGSLLSQEQMELVTYPIPFANFTDDQVAWLHQNASECGNNDNGWAEDYTPTSKELCLCLNSEWKTTITQNFDNVLRGFSLLFEISTTEGWVQVMYAAIDQRGIDMQPVRGSNELWMVYFIIFLLLGAFFLCELFIGVIIENFARIKEMKGCGLMTASQKEWALTQSFVMKIRPERRFSRPAQCLRAMCYDFVMSHSNPWFDRMIMVVIVFNTACIGAVSFGDSAAKSEYLDLFNGICSTIFVLEAAVKLVAFGKAYFRSRWNRFDFTIVFGLIIGFILELTIVDDRLASSISSVIGLMRIGRLIRLIRLIKSLRTIFNSILTAIPGILNIGGLLLLLFFVYAIIGMQLYGVIGFQGELNEHANFRSLGNAILLLFRFSTGENWNGFMWDLLQDRPECDPNPTYNSGSPWCLHEEDYPDCIEINGCSAGPSVFVYFYSFVLVVGLVVLNMFVGVVLEAFENSQESDILGPDDLDHFVSVWAEFDPDARGKIKASKVNTFLRKLRPPLGIKENNTELDDFDKEDIYFKDQSLLEIRVNENKEVTIVNVARQVAKRLVKAKQGENFKDLSTGHPISQRAMKQQDGTNMTLGEVYMNDSMIILRAVRRFRQARARRKGKPATVYPER